MYLQRNLIYLKNKANITYRDINSNTGINLSTLNALSHGHEERMSISTVKKLATYFAMSIDQLVNIDLENEGDRMPLDFLVNNVLNHEIWFINNDDQTQFDNVESITNYADYEYHENLLIQTSSCWWFEVSKFKEEWFLSEEAAEIKLVERNKGL